MGVNTDKSLFYEIIRHHAPIPGKVRVDIAPYHHFPDRVAIGVGFRKGIIVVLHDPVRVMGTIAAAGGPPAQNSTGTRGSIGPNRLRSAAFARKVFRVRD